jgi:hypothetical protein
VRLPCPYVAGEVELTEERERHIQANHPDLLPEYRDALGKTLADPDQVRRSARSLSVRLFSRWFDDIMGGKHVVVVVVTEGAPRRHWVITAYLVGKLRQGDMEWKRN